MTSVERARKFIQARGKAIAMTIVPLATLALAASQPAKAAQVLVFNSGGCVASSSGVMSNPIGSCLDTPIPGFQNGANSLKLTGLASVQAVSGGGFGSLTFEMTGSANGGIAQGVLPVSWDFYVGASQPVGSGGYTLQFRFNSGSFSRLESGGLDFNANCGDFACAHVSGSDFIGVDGPISSYDVSLTVGAFFNPGTFLQLNVPGNSIDINPQTEVVIGGAPEPASLALGGTGLLGLMLARFRRRKV